MGLIRDLHWNHLGWLSDYDLQSQIAVENGARIQEALGYRFVINEVRLPARIKPGADFQISFLVRNSGSSPFYYYTAGLLNSALLDFTTREPVWKDIFRETDIRNWLPGPAQSFRVGCTFTCPAHLERSSYIAALSILDPGGNQPSVRFAIRNYYNGGRHPLASVGVGVAPRLLPETFDDPARDGSLKYAAR